MSEVSAEMQRALAFAELMGGKLYRHAGGRWGHRDYGAMGCKWFGTPTIAALRARGLGAYTEWRDGGNWQVPVEFTIKT